VDWWRPKSLPEKLVIGIVGLSIGLLGVSVFLALKDRKAEGSPGSQSSGVFGQVMRTACNPVARTGDPPCPPYYGEIRVLRRDESLITMLHTDREGRYRVQLPPGRYIIDSNDGGKSIANREGYVIVRGGEFAQADLTHYVGTVCLFGQTWMHFASARHKEPPGSGSFRPIAYRRIAWPTPQPAE
jgi:hypothetical protein